MDDFLDLNDDSFEQEMKDPPAPPLLVAFRSTSSQVCDLVETVLLGLVKTAYKDRLRLARMAADTEEARATTEEFGVLSVPNVILFRGTLAAPIGCIGPWDPEEGKPQERRVAETLEAFLKSALQ